MGILGTATGSRSKDRKKKPDELLSSVVRETAVPAAVELLRANTAFVFPSETAFVMLVLQAEAIGGLSKRHGRDEAKGSIIELIGSDQIHTLATAEMLEEGVFGIIPTADSLERMREYSLLTGAEYSWAVVWQKPSGELLVDLVNDATFAQAQGVANGSLSLREAVGEAAWAEHSGVADEPSAADAGTTETTSDDETVDDDEDDPIFNEIPGDAVGEDEDEPVFDDVPEGAVFLDEVDEQTEAPVAAPAVEAEEDGLVGFEEFDEPEGEVFDQPQGIEPDPADAVLLADANAVRDVIARRFLSEDLDLDIRLDEFNATFAIGAPVVQIAVPEGATEWLGDQIAQLNRQANADLAQLRYAHEDQLRTLFVNLSSAHVEEVIRAVATDREGSRYKLLKDSSEQAHQDRQSQKDRKIQERKTEIVRDFEEQAERIAKQAAVQAEVQYKERNRTKMERAQADAVAEIERVIENDHSHDLQEILRVRRADAQLKMQVGTTRIFDVLAEKHSEYLAAEEERLKQWNAEIQRIVDDNRQADIVQANALAEQQRTYDEVGVLRQQHEQALEALRAEQADRTRRLEDELERSKREAVTQIAAREEEWAHNLRLEQEKTNAQSQRAADLFAQQEQIEVQVGKRYEARIAELQADREQTANEMARASEIQGRYNKVLISLIVALPILGVLAGFIVGVLQ